MSQATTAIADGTGAQVLAELTSAFSAAQSWQFGSTDPYTAGYNVNAGTWWMDQGNMLVKQRNITNDAWVTKGKINADGTISLYDDLGRVISHTYATNEFLENQLTITYVSPTSFTVSGDLTGVFTANRRVKVYLNSGAAISYVTSSTFSTVTTVTLGSAVLDATVTAVKYSIIQEGVPQDYNLALAESTGYGIVSGCTPSINGLTVTVASGVVHLPDGTRKVWSTSTTTLGAADASNPRIDLVYIDSTGTVAKVTGTAAASPSAPTLPANGIHVCTVTIVANASTGTILDSRDVKNYIHYKEKYSDESGEPKLKSYYQAKKGFLEQKTIDEAAKTITVATFNVLNENNVHRIGAKAYLITASQLTAMMMTNAQIIGLNEVYDSYNVPIGNVYNPDGIYGDYAYYATQENDVRLVKEGYNDGNAIFSCYQMTNKSGAKYTTTDPNKYYRQGYTKAEVTRDNKTIGIYQTHFDYTGAEITSQVNQLLTVISNDGLNYHIIMGDFNTDVGTTDKITPFLNAGFKQVNGGKYGTFYTGSSIDEILVSNSIEILSSGMIDVTDAMSRIRGNTDGYNTFTISDHSPLYARLRLS